MKRLAGLGRRRRLAAAALFGLGLLFGFGLTVGRAAQVDSRRALAIQKELHRRKAVRRWARETRPTYQQLFVEKNRTALEGNRKAEPVNRKLAEKFAEQATEAAGRAEEKLAEKCRQVAALFTEYAAQNLAVVAAVSQADTGGLNRAFAEIARIERELFKITGKRVRRDWFLPQELTGVRAVAIQPQPARRTGR